MAFADQMLTVLGDKNRLLVVTIPDFGVTPTGARYARGRSISEGIASFNRIINEESTKRGLRLVDVFELSKKMGTDRSLVAADGLHPSAKEYAEWEKIPQPGGLGVSIQQAAPRIGTLKVLTRRLRAGYLRKNGVPYSDQAVVTEYYDRLTLFGNDYLQVVTVVTDPTYLTTPFVVSNQFKRERDDSKWHATPCATDPPLGKFQPPVFVQ